MTSYAWLGLPPDTDEPDPAYRAVLDWVWSCSAVSHTGTVPALRALRLERMRVLLASLGDPHHRFASLLVAGTKGKGSTVAMLDACLRAAGVRAGRYTSPHLVNWRERVVVDGQPIPAAAVVRYAPLVQAAVAALPAHLGPPSTFEVGTLFAFLHFAELHVQIAAVEVGVGGREDATNVLDPLVSAITPIGYDHVATLGPTLTSIAAHKAGILRPGRPAIVGPQVPEALAEVERRAASVGAQLEQVGRDWAWHVDARTGETAIGRVADAAPAATARLALRGDHQRDNATVAVGVLNALARQRPDLAVAPGALGAGLERVEWPGRLHVLRTRPMLVLDGAQNDLSAHALSDALARTFSFRRLHLVLGMSSDKDAQALLRALAPRASSLVLTRSHHERARDPAALLHVAHRSAAHLPASTAPDLAAALDVALHRAAPDDLVLVTGSLFLVGEALTWAAAHPA